MGASVEAKSQKAAEREAIDECVTSGGGATCKSEYFSYRNQCAVIAWGINTHVGLPHILLRLQSSRQNRVTEVRTIAQQASA